MNLKMDLIENIEEDIICKIYHNDMEDLQANDKSKQYARITKKIKKIENKLYKKYPKEYIKQYIEYINERNSIEAENQFKLGFKTAMKIVFQSLK